MRINGECKAVFGRVKGCEDDCMRVMGRGTGSTAALPIRRMIDTLRADVGFGSVKGRELEAART
ncbi:hypothetical protein GALMADRAFT_254139 [Galerina marginata CBS 339.88]|uniref:Uncharacterized protein n=1 Tax=Galerina marginata (strain CBS 339.88) TaxID=685588 RepID=A0A067SKD1_GALM3|nr:hypothetical protein GALMADRAFT_254139 [Galerina marginata CBS 339.88]